MMLQTQFPFRLPRGYLDQDGTLHRNGEMRLAVANDEVEAAQIQKIGVDESYITPQLLARVITSLGTLPEITPEIVGGLFIADFRFLQNMYETINREDDLTNGWISVNNRLPEGDDGPFLVLFENESMCDLEFSDVLGKFGMWQSHYDPYTLGFVDSEFIPFEDVTHWRPLPALPKTKV